MNYIKYLVSISLIGISISAHGQKDSLERKKLSFNGSSISVLIGPKVKKKKGENSTVWSSSTSCCKYTVVAFDLSSDLSSPVQPGEYSLEDIHKLMENSTDRAIGNMNGKALAESEGK